MHNCARCGKKRNILERLFALDDKYCDSCLLDTNQEIREKCALPIRQPEQRKKGHN